MNLIIDVGNTLLKLAVIDSDNLLHEDVTDKNGFSNALKSILKRFPKIDKCMLSSVGDFKKSERSVLKEKFDVCVLTHKTKVPFTNLYASPETLGVDRIALISAAAIQYPSKNVLVIDAGSCITYDFINANNEYLGGSISPGLNMRYRSLNYFTSNLPELDLTNPENIVGDTTSASIHSGVVYGLVHEIDGFIQTYKSNYNDLTVILTGGDAHFLLDSLKSDIFANSNFLLEGLNYILEHNKDRC